MEEHRRLAGLVRAGVGWQDWEGGAREGTGWREQRGGNKCWVVSRRPGVWSQPNPHPVASLDNPLTSPGFSFLFCNETLAPALLGIPSLAAVTIHYRESAQGIEKRFSQNGREWAAPGGRRPGHLLVGAAKGRASGAGQGKAVTLVDVLPGTRGGPGLGVGGE